MVNQKPLRSSVLNRVHPHAKGLTACYLFNDKSTKVWDFTRNGNVLDVTGASLVADGLQCDANNEIAILDNTNQIINSEKGTIIFEFKSLSAITDNISRCLFGDIYLAPVSGHFGIFKYTTNFVYFWFRDSGGHHYIQIDQANFPTWTEGVHIAVVWNRSRAVYGTDKMAMLVNGAFVTPTGKAGATSWNTFTIKNSLGVGNDAGSPTVESNGVIKSLSIYNKNISLNAIKSINNKPYDMIIE